MAKTVLVVDDSAMMRKIVQKNLRELGVELSYIEAADGKEALNAFAKGGIDLILTDWNMPNMTGIELVKELRKIDPEKKVPIIMVTSEATADKVKEAVAAGVNNYVSKPFTTDVLRQKIGPLVGL